jgi:predicted nucleotidyltransferase
MDTGSDVRRIIQKVVHRLVEGYRPQQIILFGSLVYGNPDDDSDIDLLVIKNTNETPLERRVHVRRLVSEPERRIPLSPLVLTPDELAHRLALGDPFYREIVARGEVLYPYA